MKKIAYRRMYENELDHPWYFATRQLMISFLAPLIKKDAKILDAGCGTGGTITFLKNSGFKNVQGVDKSLSAINYCKQREIDNVSKSDINNLPFNSNTFDAVICMDVLYHKGVIPQKALSEIYRVLKTTGVLYLQEPSYNFFKSAHDKSIDTARRFLIVQIRNLLLKQKFKIVKISHFNSILFPAILLKRIKDKIFKKSNYASDVEKLPEPLNLMMFKTLSFESQLIKFLNFPFGLSIISIAKK